MKIGLPSALLNPYYRVFWRTFFEALDVEVVETGSTTKSIINKGIKYAVPEICVPIKIYLGHLIELMQRGVDRIYLPRFVSIKKNDSFCPKFLGLPEMVRYSIPGIEPKLIVHDLHSDNDNIATEKNYLDIGRSFTNNNKKVKEAIRIGKEKWSQFRNLCCLDGYNSREANEYILNGRPIIKKNYSIKLGVVGYVYNIYDDFISMDIINKLQQLGVSSVTFETLNGNQIQKQLQRFPKNLFWTFSNKTMAAAYHFFEDETIDGVIQVTAFGCGPDSFLGKMLELDSQDYEKPFMIIRVDEHTGENHLQTRVEAFVEMIAKRKKEKTA